MHILVTNDDGIESPGLWTLAAALHDAGLGRVTIIAPEEEHSGTSMSFPPRRAHELHAVKGLDPAHAAITAFSLNGTPVGCVTAGMLAEAGSRPDVVVSGINRGLNSGTNVMLSGTVGAAMVAALWGVPALAVSLQFVGDNEMPWPTAAWAAVQVFPLLQTLSTRSTATPLLNVNVPHLGTPQQIRGFRQTTLSTFFYGHFLSMGESERTERGGRRFSYAFDRSGLNGFDEQSDDGAVRAGFVSVTPLHPISVRGDVDLHAALAGIG
ncbi:5'/3'-nucleotidase SurE [Candidatus Gracilibacteria bacterium]|nr:5'/3'-nucleotidase SurE [Candidatus Gracilibacteria bacterium]